MLLDMPAVDVSFFCFCVVRVLVLLRFHMVVVQEKFEHKKVILCEFEHTTFCSNLFLRLFELSVRTRISTVLKTLAKVDAYE